MAEQSREFYQVMGSQSVQDIERNLNFILNRISDRLDQQEGLRGNPTFYKNVFDFLGLAGVTAGQVLKATSSTRASVSSLAASEVDNAVSNLSSGIPANVDLSQSLLSMADFENDVTIHQFPADWLNMNSDVHGFFTHEDVTPGTSGGDVTGPGSATDNNLAQFNGTSGKIIEDSGLSNANVASAITLKHTQGTDTTLGTMTANIVMDSHKLTGLAVPSTAGDSIRATAKITEALLGSATDLKHATGTDTALGAVATKNPPIDADKALYRDSTAADALVTSTWTQVKAFLKTYFDTLYVAVTGRYRYAAALADAGTITLPTITANWPAHGFIHCAHASTGVISESAEFEYGSTGAVQIIRGTANIEANAATAGKISIGAAISANPVVIKNNLGGGVSVNAMVTLWYT